MNRPRGRRAGVFFEEKARNVDLSPIVTHGAAFLIGTLTGAAGQYFADRFTDQRRRQEASREGNRQFKEVCDQMPDLIAEMKNDLSGSPLVREFFVLSKHAILNASQSHFQYYHEDIPELHSKVTILDHHGYIVETTPGNTPRYEMTEAFVTLLLNA